MGSDESSGAAPQARVVLRVDSVSACEAQSDRQGWSHLERARYAEITEPGRKAQYRVGHWRVRGLASVVLGGLPGVWRSAPDCKKPLTGGVDGTRTRDPRRDRPVF